MGNINRNNGDLVNKSGISITIMMMLLICDTNKLPHEMLEFSSHSEHLAPVQCCQLVLRLTEVVTIYLLLTCDFALHLTNG